MPPEFYCMEDYKKLLTDLYSIYDPERIKQIDYFLNKYQGKEKQFYTRQKENYENKKPISDSQKIIDEALARIKSREKEAANKEEKPSTPPPKPEKERVKTPEDKPKTVPAPPPVKEETPKPSDSHPVSEPRFPSETPARSAAEIREERSAQKPVAEHKPSEKKQTIPVTENMPEREFPPKKRKEDQHSETPPPIETDIRVKRRYFFNIFGMVLLTLVLIVIIYFTFFVETENKAKGIVQKPAGMRTEAPAKIQSDQSVVDDKEALNKTKEIDAEALKTEEISEETPNPETEIVETTEKASAKTAEKETKTSFWTWLFTKKEVNEIEEPKIAEQESAPQKIEKAETTKPATEAKPSFWDRLFAKIKVPKASKEKPKPVEKEQKTAIAEPVVNKDKEPIEVKPEPTQITENQSAEKQLSTETALDEEPAIEEEPIEQALLNTSSTSGSALRLSKEDIQFPAYFVACYAVKTEDYALVKINQLKRKGFDACYYWIPDFVPNGNPYFKVVIGPFSTSREAYRKLTPVQEYAEFDAYVITLK